MAGLSTDAVSEADWILSDAKPMVGAREPARDRDDFSSWPLTGRHANRPPLLQPDRKLPESDVVADCQRALCGGPPL
jgi:hypothetical protein